MSRFPLPALIAAASLVVVPCLHAQPDRGLRALEDEAGDASQLQLPVKLRPATLADFINDVAGREVRVVDARVVGVLEPHSFLIESATYEATLGLRSRVLVLIRMGRLRVPPEELVSSTVTVLGVARTLLGTRVGADVPWPARLTSDRVQRLEVRAAIVATSVQTAEGVELTDQPASAGR